MFAIGYWSSTMMSLWQLQAAIGARKTGIACSDDLRLRMAGAFLYQEENISMISEQTVWGLNRIVLISCNNFLQPELEPLPPPPHLPPHKAQTWGSGKHHIQYISVNLGKEGR